MAGISKNSKSIEIDGRQFQVNKFTATTGIKIAKTLASKIIPVFDSFFPMIQQAMSGSDFTRDELMANLDTLLDFDGISKALDMVSEKDLDYIMNTSLTYCYEVLPAGNAQVRNEDGTYGVQDIEYDAILVLRLVVEAIKVGVGDFFDGNRLTSTLGPMVSLLSPSQET